MAKKKKRRSPWPIALTFRLILILSAGALLISYISIYINPSITSIPLFFGLYFIPLVLLNVFLLIVGLLRRSGATWITFTVLLPSLLFADLFVGWGNPEKEDDGLALKICSYNVGMFAQQSSRSKNESLREIASFLKRQDPSIICIQEFFIKDTSIITSSFDNYPYKYYHLFNLKSGSKFGNITLSKFPIVSSGKITFKGSTNLCIYTDIEHFGKILRIYNIHLESLNISFTSLIKRMSNSEKASREIIDVHDKLAVGFKKRAHQVDSISIHSANSKYPSIICGDFNDTPLSYTYHNLIYNKKDSFKESGNGLSATYKYLWPLLRIDYILFPKDFWSLSHNTIKVPYSDHYPIFAEIIIP